MPEPTETLAETPWSWATIAAWLGTAASGNAKQGGLIRIANGVGSLLERETGWRYVRRAFTEVQDGTGSCELWLQEGPVVSVTSITVLRSPTDSAPEVVAPTNYRANLATGRVQTHADRFTRGIANVTVVYTAGFGTKDEPDTKWYDAFHLGLDIIKMIADEKHVGATAVTQVAIGPSTFIVKPDWPKHVREGLMNLKRPQI
jgi:hypothetical protein